MLAALLAGNRLAIEIWGGWRNSDSKTLAGLEKLNLTNCAGSAKSIFFSHFQAFDQRKRAASD
ncbi:MAG: hypothetical protein LBD77_07305 [Bifidobacteriaceae bacterium]|jgi:hypothetical protein|nr:hypothetical protein [Bifidobacteriaceae bacterium]